MNSETVITISGNAYTIAIAVGVAMGAATLAISGLIDLLDWIVATFAKKGDKQ